MESLELLKREIHAAHDSLLEPTASSTVSRTTSKDSVRSSTSPITSQAKRRLTTIGNESNVKKKALKTYGSKGSQDDLTLYSSDVPWDAPARKKIRLGDFASNSADIMSRGQKQGDQGLGGHIPKSDYSRSQDTIPLYSARIAPLDDNDASITPLGPSRATILKADRKRSTTLEEDKDLTCQGKRTDILDGEPLVAWFPAGVSVDVATSNRKKRLSRRATMHALSSEKYEESSEHPHLLENALLGENEPAAKTGGEHYQPQLSLVHEDTFLDPAMVATDQSSWLSIESETILELQPDGDHSEVSTAIPYSLQTESTQDIHHRSVRPTASTGQFSTATAFTRPANEISNCSSTKLDGLPSQQDVNIEVTTSEPGDKTHSPNTEPTPSFPGLKEQIEAKTFEDACAQQSEGHDELPLPALTTLNHKTKNMSKANAKATTRDNHSDELGFDEDSVGLPKEQYIPRPSRSRASRVVDDMVLAVDFSKRPEAVAKRKGIRRKTTGDTLAIYEDECENLVVFGIQNSPLKTSADSNVVGSATKAPLNPSLQISPTVDQDVASKDPYEDTVKVLPPKKKRGRPKKHVEETSIEVHDARTQRLDPVIETRVEEERSEKPSSKTTRKRRRTEEERHCLSEDVVVEDDEILTAKHAMIGHIESTPSKPQDIKEADANIIKPAPNAIDSPERLIKDTTPSITETRTPICTPQKPQQKGPDKHSPLNNSKISYRVGLSKRARIEPLLRVVKK